NELVHVPMFIRYPDGFPAGQRVEHEVSTRRIFHTALEAAGIRRSAYGESTDALTLSRSVAGFGAEPEEETVVAEGFPPLNFINAMEMSHPEAVGQFRLRKPRRALFQNGRKLMSIGDQSDEFFATLLVPGVTNTLLD